MTKRCLLFALAIIFVLMLLPSGGVIVHADLAPYFTGSGTQANPYVISTPEGMKYLADTVNAGTSYSGVYFSMANDIDLAAYEWMPIGSFNTPFVGTFDGQSYAIKNLLIGEDDNHKSYRYAGLFGYVKNTIIKNIEIDSSCKIFNSKKYPNDLYGNTVYTYTGGVVGNAVSSSIDHCINRGTIWGRDFTGGIAGSASKINGSDADSSISNSINYGSINNNTTDYNAWLGGIAAGISGTGSNCINNGSVTGAAGGTGGICGGGSELQGCYNNGTVIGAGNAVGGIAGYSATIVGCYNTGAVNSGATNTGGLVGYLNYIDYIFNSYNKGAVSSSGTSVGGICGSAYGEYWEKAPIINCYQTGNITSTGVNANVGGIIGDGSNNEIKNTYTIGSITSSSVNIGAVAGKSNYIKFDGSYYLDGIAAKAIGTGSGNGTTTALSLSKMQSGELSSILNNFTNYNLIINNIQLTKWSWSSGINSSMPILCGIGEGSNVESFTITASAGANGVISPSGEVIAYEKSSQLFIFQPNAEYIIENVKIDGIDMGVIYQYLFNKIDANHTISVSFVKCFDMAGTLDDPYLIDTPVDLKYVSDSVSSGVTFEGKYLKLASDIDLTGLEFKPIGIDQKPFKGNFDGNYRTISNLIVGSEEVPVTGYAGLFGYAVDATIKNINVDNSCCFYGGNEEFGGGYIGSIAGFVFRSTVSKCVSYAKVWTKGNREQNIGGLFGIASSSTINNCSFLGNVNGESTENYISVGGIAGLVSYGTTLDGCSSFGVVSGVGAQITQVGGIAGKVEEQSVITKCYNTGNVSASCSNDTNQYGSIVGGIVGEMYKSEIAKCVNTGLIVSIGESNTYCSYAGGIVGSFLQSSKVSECINNGDVFNLFAGSSYSDSGGIAGRLNNYYLNTYPCVLINCKNYATVFNQSVCGNSDLGGIVGYLYGASIVNGSNNGLLLSENYCYNSLLGGIAGYADGATILNCYNANELDDNSNYQSAFFAGGLVAYSCNNTAVKNSYNKGSIIAKGYFGGVCGATINSTYTNCYYLNTASTRAFGSGSGGASQYSDSMMKAASFVGTLNSFWNTAALPAGYMKEQLQVWAIDAGKNNGYPYLQGANEPIVLLSAQSGDVYEAKVCSAVYDLYTENIEDFNGFTINWYSDPFGLNECDEPIGITPEITTYTDGGAALEIMADTAAKAGEYYFALSNEGVSSPICMLSIVAWNHAGDANDDGNVDVFDAVHILRYSAGLQTITGECLDYADANGDGGTDVFDAVEILRYAAGLTNKIRK